MSIQNIEQSSLKMQQTVLQQLIHLKTLDVEALHTKWSEFFGTEPPRYKRHFLIRRLAWRIQEMYWGGLSSAAQGAMAALIANDSVATAASTIPAQPKKIVSPLNGTRFVRIWKGEKYIVEAQENGFIFNGRPYRSLSAIAKEITGTKWNGNVFFGLKKAGKENGK